MKTPQPSEAEREKILSRISGQFNRLLASMQIEHDLSDQLSQIYLPLAAAIRERFLGSEGTLVVGINGAQGSGKSTLCALLEMILHEGFGLRTTTLSIDDLYLTRKERRQLSESVHPLLITRGVPGTHDTRLGIAILNELRRSEADHCVSLPVFDKAMDDRMPAGKFRRVLSPVDVVLFEGWCIGARPQQEEALIAPANELEENEDQDGVWRQYVNQQLATSYKQLFSAIDLLIMLKTPSFDSVYEWRSLQEKKLASSTPEQARPHIMNERALRRFIMHYERLTRFTLLEMPERADIENTMLVLG